MTDQPTCPNCKHTQHLPGTECSTRVEHGPNRWHLCLCLARPGAAPSCPPQMTCQGGTLGYADIWYLQHGHSLMSDDGVISPEVLKAVSPRPAVEQSAPVDQAALRDRLAVLLAEKDGWEYAKGFGLRDMSEATQQHYDKLAAAVVAVLPAPTDRRTLTPDEHSSAWHAIEGSAGEEGADPGTVLAAVLRALNIDGPPTP